MRMDRTTCFRSRLSASASAEVSLTFSHTSAHLASGTAAAAGDGAALPRRLPFACAPAGPASPGGYRESRHTRRRRPPRDTVGKVVHGGDVGGRQRRGESGESAIGGDAAVLEEQDRPPEAALGERRRERDVAHR